MIYDILSYVLHEGGIAVPSSTFFNLPDAKRQKLLTCARAEFSRVPYAEASINRIIKAAGIPRGSFYMYFEDKGDLFRHLLNESIQQVITLMSHLLQEQDGDLFAAFLALFDFVQVQHRQDPSSHFAEELAAVLRLNNGLPEAAILFPCYSKGLIAPLLSLVDTSNLNLQKEGDLDEIIRLIFVSTAPLVYHGLLAEDPAQTRADLVNVFAILARGMKKNPAPLITHS